MRARLNISSKVFVIGFVFCLGFQNVNGFFRIRKPDPPLDPPESVDVRTVSTNWFEQKVDHFTPTDSRTWKQRYHVNDAYYNESSKNHIFLMISGEWTANPRWVNYGAWIESANQYGALLVNLEHRFYGESYPLSELTTENLKYLSTHQALEDIATFIQGMNKAYNLTTSEAKWVVFGGSYAGTLAAWLRQKYPHLVAGAMSSSGPLEAILDFNEYLEVVIDGMSTHSTACVTSIKSAFSQLETLVASCLEDTEIYSDLDTTFKLCETIENSESNDQDLANLFEILTDNNFAYVVQYHGIPNTRVSIDDLCEIMVNETSDTTELYRLAEVNNLLLNVSGDTCTDYKYSTRVEDWQNTTASSNTMTCMATSTSNHNQLVDAVIAEWEDIPQDTIKNLISSMPRRINAVIRSKVRQWLYQTCTEFGFFQTSTQENPIFGSRFDISFFTGLCQDVFGAEFNETMINLGIQATNNRYAGKSINTSNIVYFHGSIDPWHVLGKLESSSNEHTVIVVDGVSHCANMYPALATDSAALAAAKKEVNTLVGQWLGVDTSEDNSSNTMTSSIVVFSSLLICLYQLF